MNGARLISEIEYVNGVSETMDFELFTPEEIADRATRFGLAPIEPCCWWDRKRPPTPDEQRFQMVLERK